MRTLTLPFPPSINHYWRLGNGHMHISNEGRAYKSEVEVLARAAGIEFKTERLALMLVVSPPDRRRRDLDNLQKPLLDAMKGSVYADDWQIDLLLTIRDEPIKGGLVVVRIDQMDSPQQALAKLKWNFARIS